MSELELESLFAKLESLSGRDVLGVATRFYVLEALDQVAAVLSSPDSSIGLRCGALRVLSERRCSEHAGLVATQLLDSDPIVRELAASALGRLGNGDAEMDLQRGSRDPVPVVRMASVDALSALGLEEHQPGQARLNQELRHVSAMHSMHFKTDSKADRIVELVSQGAVVDGVDSDGVTAFLKASAHGPLAAMKKLVELGASTGMQDDRKRDALHYACSHGTLTREIVEWILALGLSPTREDLDGRSALFDGAWSMNRDAYIPMLSLGAVSPELLTQLLGRTAQSGNLELATLLLEYGAKCSDEVCAQAEDGHHFALVAVFRAHDGKTKSWVESSEARTRMQALARELGKESAQAARDSGDYDYYTDDPELDPDDLNYEFWDSKYLPILRRAIDALDSNALTSLPEQGKLQEQLYDLYEKAYEDEI